MESKGGDRERNEQRICNVSRQRQKAMSGTGSKRGGCRGEREDNDAGKAHLHFCH